MVILSHKSGSAQPTVDFHTEFFLPHCNPQLVDLKPVAVGQVLGPMPGSLPQAVLRSGRNVWHVVVSGPPVTHRSFRPAVNVHKGAENEHAHTHSQTQAGGVVG
jgi:hypothetical protein